MKQKTIIFDKELNKFARKYFIKNNGPNERELLRNARRDFAYIEKYVASLFLYYDCVCFNVYGENVLVPYLINLFGEKGFENLLEQGAIKFLLDSSNIMYPVTPIQGVNPLAAGGFTSPAHSNPEESLKIGLTWAMKPYNRKYRRNVSKKILKEFKKHPEQL